MNNKNIRIIEQNNKVAEIDKNIANILDDLKNIKDNKKTLEGKSFGYSLIMPIPLVVGLCVGLLFITLPIPVDSIFSLISNIYFKTIGVAVCGVCSFTMIGLPVYLKKESRKLNSELDKNQKLFEEKTKEKEEVLAILKSFECELIQEKQNKTDELDFVQLYNENINDLSNNNEKVKIKKKTLTLK